MTMHLVSPATSPRRTLGYRSMPARLGALAVAVLFTATQIRALGPIPHGNDAAQPATSSQQAAASAPATAADLSASTPLVSAPDPNIEQAAIQPSLGSLFAIDNSQDPTPAAPPASSLTSTTKKPKTHDKVIGGILAGVGTPLFIVGAATFILGVTKCKGSICGTWDGITGAGMAAGGAMAAGGYYLLFKK